MKPPLVFCLTIGLIIVHRWRKRKRSRDLHKIPLGPGSLPVIGHVSILKALKAQKIQDYLVDFGMAAGESGILRLTVLGATRVVLTAPETVAAALNKSTHLPKPAGVYNVFYMFGIKAPTVGMLSDATEHARVRGHMQKFFCAENITMMVEQLVHELDTTLAAIDAAAAGSDAAKAAPRLAADPGSLPRAGEAGIYTAGPAGVLVDAVAMAKGTVMRVVFRVFLGTEQIAPLDAVEDTMEQVTAVAGHPLHYQLMRRGLLPGYRRYRRNWQALHDYHCELAREAYARPMPDDCTAFWATVRRAFPAALTDARELEHAAANLSLYMAAYETTAAAVTHTLAALALDQDSQTALAEELREAGLLAEPGRPPPRTIARDDLARMAVLDAVCHESLRLMPPSPVGGLRELGKDTKIGGYMVPKGTALIIPPCALHACEHAWGPDAGEWRPDRWLEGRSIAAAKMTANGHPRFLAFFGGPADCIGQHLAVVELKLVVASLIGRLHITMDQQLMPYMHTVSDYMAATVMSVNLHCDGPCWLRMRPRAPAAHAAA